MQSVDGDVRLSVGLETKSLKANLSNLSNKISSIFKQSSQSADKANSSYLNLQNNIRNTSNKLDDLIRKQDRLGKQKIPTEEYKAISSQIEKAQMRLNRLMAKQDEYVELGKSKKSTVWAKMQRDIEETTMEIQYAKGELQELIDTGKAFTLGADTDAYRKLGQDIDNYKSKLEALNVKQDEANAKQEKTHKTVSPLRKGVSKLFKTWRDKMKEPFERMKRFGMMFKNMMLMSMGMMAILGAARMLLQGVSQGFKNLSKQSQEVNEDISMVVSSLTHLKNSLATAFQPILSVIAPILSAFIDLLSASAAAIASFFAALTGQGYIYKATKANENFAASIAGAGGAAKEANEELAEYDKLMVIQQDASGGGGGGGGALGEAGTFEKAEIAPGISSLADMIKESWRNSDFTEIGSIIGSKIKGGLEKIPWDDIKLTASKIAKSFATLLNGIFQTPGLFAEVGSTLAEALNTIFTLKADFLGTLDWDAIGISIADFINELFSTLNWETFADSIGNLATGLLTMINSALKTIDWNAIGEDIRTFLVSLPWVDVLKGVGQIIVNAIVGGIDLVSGITGLPWEVIAGGIAAVILAKLGAAKALSGLSLGLGLKIAVAATVAIGAFKIGNWLYDNIPGVQEWADALAELILGDYTWEEIGNALKDMFTDIVIDPVIKFGGKVAEGAGEFLFGGPQVGELLTNQQIDANGFEQMLQIAIKLGKLTGTGFTWQRPEDAKKDGKKVGEAYNAGLKEGVNIDDITEYSNTIGSTMFDKEKTNKLATTAYNEAFDATTRAYSVAKIGNHFTNIQSKIIGSIANLPSKFSSIFSNAATNTENSYSSTRMGNHFKAVVGTIVNSFATVPSTFTTIANNMVSAFNNVPTEFGAMATTASNNTKSPFLTLPTTFSGIFSEMLSNSQTAFSAQALSTHFTGVAASVKGPFSGIPQWFTTTFTSAWNNVKAVFSDSGGVISSVTNASTNVFKNVVNGLVGGLNTAMTNPFETLNNIVTKLRGFKFMGMAPFANLPLISVPRIPFLAEGAVIPPNNEFMAVLGDQKRGVNIETPLETMIQAFTTALDSRGNSNDSKEPIILQISGRTIAELVWDANTKRYKQTGTH